MRGYLLVDKPAGWTSFDVVNKLRRASGVKKVGHAGTLDPFATGLLILLFGDYTKKQDSFMKMDKVYSVGAVLGQVSSTGDPEGDIIEQSTDRPSLPEVEAAIQTFLGQIQQVPPAHSAIKINGQRAYDLARKGKEVIIEPRAVTINAITNISYEYPELRFTTDVSSGTYIRSLVSDIGKKLGVGAYTSQLSRDSIGEYVLTDAISMDDVPDVDTADFIAAHLKTVEEA